MNLKVGDSLLCKKTTNFDPIFTIKYNNEYYIVTEIFDDMVYFGNDFYYNDFGKKYYIWNYFYTSQEVRKMKLKQLMKVEK